jgi:hypothetical protein
MTPAGKFFIVYVIRVAADHGNNPDDFVFSSRQNPDMSSNPRPAKKRIVAKGSTQKGGNRL